MASSSQRLRLALRPARFHPTHTQRVLLSQTHRHAPHTQSATHISARRRFSSSSSTFPIVNVAALTDPSSSLKSRQAVAEELHRACVNVGFLYVINHGVDSGVMVRAMRLANKFFDLPQAEKERISIMNLAKQHHANGSSSFLSCRGYQKVGENVTKYARDLHEGLDMYREAAPGESDLKGFDGRNPWLPDVLVPGFRHIFETEYVQAMLGLGNRLMRGFALGFGLPEGYFEPYYDKSFWCMRLIRYPPMPPSYRESLDQGYGCGEHSDYGCLTLLHMDDSTHALQAQTVDGEWRFADPIPGAYLVNIGDMLSRWSNGKFRSTPHRVLPAVGKPRTSIPFFFEPNLDTWVVPLESCKQYAKGRAFEPVVFADHLRAKVSNNFSFLPDGAAEGTQAAA